MAISGGLGISAWVSLGRSRFVIMRHGERPERDCCFGHPGWNRVGLIGKLEANAPVPLVILGTRTCLIPVPSSENSGISMIMKVSLGSVPSGVIGADSSVPMIFYGNRGPNKGCFEAVGAQGFLWWYQFCKDGTIFALIFGRQCHHFRACAPLPKGPCIFWVPRFRATSAKVTNHARLSGWSGDQFEDLQPFFFFLLKLCEGSQKIFSSALPP